MNESFGSIYAESYDALYQDKDYEAECDLIERIFETYVDGSVRTVLDLGCGTGNHAIPLAGRGYDVVGVDRSPDMFDRAREKAAALPSGVSGRPSGGRSVTFEVGDIRDVELTQEFDAVLMMFAVLGYQLENADVLAALRTARRHVRPGGLLIFDVWYGPAVLSEKPSERTKDITTPQGVVTRAASGRLDTRHHLCTVDFHVRKMEGKRVVAETRESHSVRYFFPLELELFLDCSGFALARLGAFPDFDRDAGDTTWNILGVARAV